MQYVNDYRGIDSLPNVDSVEVWEIIQNAPRIFFLANRAIDVLEEIVLDYGLGFWEERLQATPQTPARSSTPEIIDVDTQPMVIDLTAKITGMRL